MINPTRRNRNIGTAKQGFSKDNELTIPYPAVEMKSFFERLDDYKTVEKVINGHRFKFVIEKTRKNSFHACTIEDIERIVSQIPKSDYGELELIILRQPTRKEENLKPVWGRLIYSYEFENNFYPAIIIEATDLDRTFKWTKKLSIDSQKELERLKEDGHKINLGKRHYEAPYEIENVRSTQLYRTLPHEFGHYVHYLKLVKWPLLELKNKVELLDQQISDDDTSETNPLFDQWDSLDDEYTNRLEKSEDQYFSLPTSEKEVFAHTYADQLKRDLKSKGIIPFNRILDGTELANYDLEWTDFSAEKEHNKH